MAVSDNNCIWKMFIVGVLGAAVPTAASAVPSIWTDLFLEIERGATTVPWRGEEELEAWATRERARLEPILLSVLRGERVAVQWSRVLPVTSIVFNDEICRVIHEQAVRLADAERGVDAQEVLVRSTVLGASVRTFASARYLPARHLTTRLATDERESLSLVEQCVLALQEISDASSIEVLRSLPHRQTHPSIDRLCAVVEQRLSARLAGMDWTLRAQQDLVKMVRSFVDALRSRDPDRISRHLETPVGSMEPDADSLRSRLAQQPGLDLASELAQVLDRGTAFSVDQSARGAWLDFGKRRLLCVLEPAGWKVSHIVQMRENGR